jgi:hypothetical protein
VQAQSVVFRGCGPAVQEAVAVAFRSGGFRRVVPPAALHAYVAEPAGGDLKFSFTLDHRATPGAP